MGRLLTTPAGQDVLALIRLQSAHAEAMCVTSMVTAMRPAVQSCAVLKQSVRASFRLNSYEMAVEMRAVVVLN
jgi:hypothetical protein